MTNSSKHFLPPDGYSQHAVKTCYKVVCGCISEFFAQVNNNMLILHTTMQGCTSTLKHIQARPGENNFRNNAEHQAHIAGHNQDIRLQWNIPRQLCS